jgi:alpha-D-ribose 1-methylphosphonate 5-triphosphate diphosphatase
LKLNAKLICNGILVLPEKAIRADLLIENNMIKDIYSNQNSNKTYPANVEIIDATGMFVLPGLIDIHCDAIEKEVQPRPNTFLPMDLALFELEKKLASNGITTMYHSLSLGTGLSLRGDHLLFDMINQIKQYRAQRSMMHHRIHLRYEINHIRGLQLAKELIENDLVDYLSYMNHSPGNGQYKDPGSFEAYVMKNQGVTQEEVRLIIDNLLKRQEMVDMNALKSLAELSISKGISLASHDDDSIEKINESIFYGTSVSEFPLNLEAAAYAKQKNLYVCVGAPNVVRGQSHDKNMRAIDAINEELVDILCSDYLPSTLLIAVFKLQEEGIDLSKAVKMVSLNPAKAMGIDSKFGSIEVGKMADLLLVKTYEGYPFIHKTMVGGIKVYQANFRS